MNNSWTNQVRSEIWPAARFDDRRAKRGQEPFLALHSISVALGAYADHHAQPRAA
jgi:hypothetical protein